MTHVCKTGVGNQPAMQIRKYTRDLKENEKEILQGRSKSSVRRYCIHFSCIRLGRNPYFSEYTSYAVFILISR
jgi:hypothetical protein